MQFTKILFILILFSLIGCGSLNTKKVLTNEETYAHVPDTYFNITHYYRTVFWRTVDIENILMKQGLDKAKLLNLAQEGETLCANITTVELGIECRPPNIDLKKAKVYKSVLSTIDFTNYGTITQIVPWEKVSYYCNIDIPKLHTLAFAIQNMDHLQNDIFLTTCKLYDKYSNLFDNIPFPEKVYCPK